MILVVVVRIPNMPHFIPMTQEDSPPVERGHLKNDTMYCGSAEDVVSARPGTFKGQYVSDL